MSENKFQKEINPSIYNACPKSVMAAMVVQLLQREYFPSEGDWTEDDWLQWLQGTFLREWYSLHINGIVPEKPGKGLWDFSGDVGPEDSERKNLLVNTDFDSTPTFKEDDPLEAFD